VGATAASEPAWTTVADVLRQLRRRWDSGAFLTVYTAGSPWVPLSVSVRGPTSAELAERFGEVQDWVRQWERVNTRAMRLEYKTVGGRIIGANDIPCRVWVDSHQQLWALLGVSREARWFSQALAEADERSPRLVPWMRVHPMRVLTHRPEWAKIVDTVRWIDAHSRAGTYLRQVDVPGVDTKFIESHRAILTELLDEQLLGDRIDQTRPRSDFVGRYRFQRKPEYVRFRLLDHTGRYGGFSELSVRTKEFTTAPAGVSTVYVVENETTYLAFPPAEGAMVIFGGGYAVTTLQSLPWLADTALVYWGDIDTHGFAILNRLRARFATLTSLLMDRATMLAHESQWVTEAIPVNDHLDHLRPDEADLYRDLVEGTFGPSIRLEQERIRFSAVEQAVKG
jgi:hypothetical protein